MDSLEDVRDRSDVSLFTREWIEMPLQKWMEGIVQRLPLYEGVD